MNAVLPEEIRPIHARAVPVYQGGVTVTRHAVGDDGVVWAFPVAGDPNADEHDYTPVAQRLHHRIELPCREYAVVAHVDDHRFAQPSRGAALLQNPDHILRLPPDDSVDFRAPNGAGQLCCRTYHDGVAERGYCHASYRHVNGPRDRPSVWLPRLRWPARAACWIGCGRWRDRRRRPRGARHPVCGIDRARL